MARGAESGRGIPESLPASPALDGELTVEAFERRDVVGRGGNATVSVASVPGSTDVLALKEPHVTDPVPPAVAERFRREAETWAGIDDHDHVLGVRGWGTEQHPWIALEYADSGSLADAGEWGLDRAVWTGACVATALEHAHHEGIAHLDLTPGNVLLCEAGDGDAWAVPKVADWGLARALESETANLEGLSPRYAAPEQFAPDRFGAPGAATDVYALGVLVYELLVGTVPFEGPPRALREDVLEATPPPASGRNPDLPSAFDDVLDRALAKRPGDRYDSVTDFRRALEGLAGDAPTASDPLAGVAGRDPRPDPEADAATAVDTGDAAVESRPTSPYDRAVVLADEGFVRLTAEYFARRDPAPPLEAWRRGVTLADARAGRAVDRTVEVDGERVDLVERILDGAVAGTDQVVLGPPGSGKSTVCKRVACEWYESGRGPVFYRESGGRRFEDSDALARRVTDTDGHALVVVEDAVRPEADAVFEFRERVADAEDVTLLVDARESEWRDAGRGGGSFGDDPVVTGREAFEPVYVPRPDRHEHERFVRAVEDAADRSLDVDVERLRAAVRRAAAGDGGDGARPGELFSLLHRLTALARDPLAEPGETTLTDAVAEVYDALADAGEGALDVGVCANALNAAGIGVYPALLYAGVDDPLAVDEAVEVLDGRVVFPREADWSDGATAYPAVHEAWSAAFLTHLVEAEGETGARDRFGRVMERTLSLAADPETRDRVAGALPDDGSTLARIEREPDEWADETVEAVYELGREYPKLAPLYGDGERDSFSVPEACSSRVVEERPVWLGRMFLDGDDYDRAERAYERLPEAGEGSLERALGLGHVALEGGEYDRAREHLNTALTIARERDERAAEARAHGRLGATALYQGAYDRARERIERSLELHRERDDSGGEARALDNLGHVARLRGEIDRAREYFERSLELKRELGDRKGRAVSLHNLGIATFQQGEQDLAREFYERSLELKREVGDRKGQATSLNNLGEIANQRGDYDAAREYFERSLERKREIGDSRGAASSLGNVGMVAFHQAEYETARETLRRSLDRKRDLGDRKGQANTLHNLGEVARLRGEYDRARDRYEASLDVARDIGSRALEALDYHRLGELARLQGDTASARERYQQALDVSRELDFPTGIANCLLGLGTVARHRGEYDRAEEYYGEALETLEDVDVRLVRLRCLLATGKLAVAHGDVERARERANRAEEAFEEMGTTHWEGRAQILLGRVAAATDDPESAREHWRTALETFEEVGAPQDALAALRHLVETCRGAGDDAAARRWCERARAVVEESPEPVVEHHGSWVDRECGRDGA